MRTCFVCGNNARWVDKESGEPLCANHFHPFRKSHNPMKPRYLDDGMRRLRAKAIWMAESAYEIEYATALRLARQIAAY